MGVKCTSIERTTLIKSNIVNNKYCRTVRPEHNNLTLLNVLSSTVIRTDKK